MKAIKLNAANMSIEVVEASAKRTVLDQAYEMIDCRLIDVVYANGLPEPYVMVVDDEGLLVDEPRLNVIGSILYGMREHGQPIVGNAIIMKDVMTEDGKCLGWLTNKDVAKVLNIITKAV